MLKIKSFSPRLLINVVSFNGAQLEFEDIMSIKFYVWIHSREHDYTLFGLVIHLLCSCKLVLSLSLKCYRRSIFTIRHLAFILILYLQLMFQNKPYVTVTVISRHYCLIFTTSKSGVVVTMPITTFLLSSICHSSGWIKLFCPSIYTRRLHHTPYHDML